MVEVLVKKKSQRKFPIGKINTVSTRAKTKKQKHVS